MENKITISISIENSIFSKLLQMKKEDESIENFIERTLKNKVNFLELIDGYKFDLTQSLLYNKDNKAVSLTRLETKVIEKLVSASLENIDKYVSIKELSEYGWKGKHPTIYSLRNIINKIRIKTCDSLLINKSNHGYKISVKKENKIIS